jgi:hypothetical protein
VLKYRPISALIRWTAPSEFSMAAPKGRSLSTSRTVEGSELPIRYTLIGTVPDARPTLVAQNSTSEFTPTVPNKSRATELKNVR